MNKNLNIKEFIVLLKRDRNTLREREQEIKTRLLNREDSRMLRELSKHFCSVQSLVGVFMKRSPSTLTFEYKKWYHMKPFQRRIQQFCRTFMCLPYFAGLCMVPKLQKVQFLKNEIRNVCFRMIRFSNQKKLIQILRQLSEILQSFEQLNNTKSAALIVNFIELGKMQNVCADVNGFPVYVKINIRIFPRNIILKNTNS